MSSRRKRIQATPLSMTLPFPAAAITCFQTFGSVEAINVERTTALDGVFGAHPCPARRAETPHFMSLRICRNLLSFEVTKASLALSGSGIWGFDIRQSSEGLQT